MMPLHFLLMTLLLSFVLSSGNVTAAIFEQHLPLTFPHLQHIETKAGGFTLASQVKQQPGLPLVIECENATDVSLFGAGTEYLREDAGDGQAIRHAMGLTFQITTLDTGEYRFWLRAWGKNSICGPAYFTVDGQSLGRLPDYPSKVGGWVWIPSQPFRLEPGKHRISLNGDTIYWGATLDRVMIAKTDTPAPTGVGPATTPCALEGGVMESDWVIANDVSKWSSLGITVAENGCVLRWFARQEKDGQWLRINPADLSDLDPKHPLQFRVEIDANPAGTTPWIGSGQIQFEGTPRTVTLSPGVSYIPTTKGGCQVRTDNYEITFTPDGQIEKLKVGNHEAIIPLENGKGGGRLVYQNGTVIAPGQPQLQSDGSLASRGEFAYLQWRFKPDIISLDVLGFNDNLFLFLQVPTDRTSRIINARTGRDSSKGGLFEKASPQIFFPDGSNVLADDDNWFGGAYGCRLDKDQQVCGSGLYIGMWFNSANPWHKRFVLHAKPTVADALELSVEAEPKDFNFASGQPAQLRFPAHLLYGLTWKGRVDLVCDQLYADPPPVKIELKQEVMLGTDQTPITWFVKPPKPGLYNAAFRLFDQDKIIREMKCIFSYGMDAVSPPARPADFDEFWSRTMQKLDAVPPEVKRTKQFDTPNGTQYLLSFKTINGWPAWAVLRVPKKQGKHPAMLLLPPVATGPPLYGDYEDRVQLGVEIRGFDPSLPEVEAANRNVVNYCGPGEMKPAETRETVWLYYAYCTIARAYDLLSEQPEVDPNRIYITGVSQGGGLALAAASLRPQNAGALAIVPGLCRLDWYATNGGGWGPRPSPGSEFNRQLRELSYFDACNLLPRLRSRLALAVGLLDDHTPPHAAINAFQQLSTQIHEKRLLVNPWGGHGGWPELDKIIPTWIEEDVVKIEK